MHPHHHGNASLGLWPIWLFIATVLVLYLWAVSRRSGWSPWRTASFVLGGLLLLGALCAPMVDWAHSDLRGHMAQHLLLGMLGPFFLVMGAPVTVLLGALPTAPAHFLVKILHSAPARFLSHPVPALILNTGGMVLLYTTPLYAASKNHFWLHALVHYHFVAAGYLFAWAIAGPDPAPNRPSLRIRGVVLFASIAVHSTLGKLMYAYGWPSGTGATRREIESAAQWMYYGGDLAEALIVIALFSLWLRRSQSSMTEPGATLLDGQGRMATGALAS